MIFIWRNDDLLRLEGHIALSASSLEEARERADITYQGEVLERIRTEDPIETIA